MQQLFRSILLIMAITIHKPAGAEATPDKNLSAKQQSLVSIAAFAGKGDLPHLKTELNTGLESGLTVNQIKEALVQVYAYAGFPRSLQALQTFMTVLDERKAEGITDKTGPDASPIHDRRPKYESGKAVLEKLTGVSEKSPKTGYAAFAPVIEVFLKEHLFADIFERDILTYPERELVTVSVLASICGVEPMLRSHLTICLHVGLTPDQLRQFTAMISSKIGQQEGTAAVKILDAILENKK